METEQTATLGFCIQPQNSPKTDFLPEGFAIPEHLISKNRTADGYILLPVEDDDDLYWPEYDDVI
ncbi:MAG: hypothetical protein LBN97_03840 [Oscillospiraceae bacterium]|jgi:hypothetical protein|nr:hypothetical protein [Oscillospiraceae bacterium]